MQTLKEIDHDTIGSLAPAPPWLVVHPVAPDSKPLFFSSCPVGAGSVEFEDVTFDVIVDFAGFGTTTAQAVDVIRRDGTVVLVGMGKLESTINTKSLILNQCNLKGSNGGSKEDVAGIYEYMATGKLNPTITTIGFDEIADGIEKLKNGEVVGRLVASYE